MALAINLTGCPCHCPGCHSPYLWEETGEAMTCEALDSLIAHCGANITCVALMGGDREPCEVDSLMRHVREKHSKLRTAWYSGRSLLGRSVDVAHFDYIKLGPYLSHLGGLRNRNTNQRFYRVDKGKLHDETFRFWGRVNSDE